MGKDNIKTLLKTAEKYYLGKEVKKDFEKAFGLYLKVIEQDKNNAKANYRLGMCYYKGVGTEKNRKKGIRHLKIAAENGSASAALQLGKYYMSSKNNKDPEVACKYYEIAAAKGDVTALNTLGDFYREGIDTEVNDKKAFDYYVDALGHDSPYAMYRCGQFYFNGTGVTIDTETALDLWNTGADIGSAECAYELGRYYFNEYYNIKCDPYKKDHCDPKLSSRSAHFLKQAVDASKEGSELHYQALYELAALYLFADGDYYKPDEGVVLITRAAEGGCNRAQKRLANMYMTGQDVPENVEEAIKWQEKALATCDKEDESIIKADLAMFYYTRNDKSKGDIEKAIELFTSAIEIGEEKVVEASLYFLTRIYREELNDPQKSFDLSMSFADNGLAAGDFLVGLHYMFGWYVFPSKTKSAKWLKKALDKGYKDAANFL